MVILAPDGTVIGGTAGAARAAGVAPAALFEGRSILEIAPANGSLIMSTVAHIAATGEEVDDVFVPYAAADGVTELYRQTYFPIAGADGSIESVGLVVEEIGEQEKVRSRLRSFEALVDQADDFIAVASLDDHMLYLNRAGRELVGQEPGAALLPDTADYVMPDFRWRLPVKSGINPMAPWRGRLNLRHAVTGEPIEVDATLFVVRDAVTGTAIFRAAVMRDTREHTRLLRRLELHVDRMPVALITVDSLGRILGWNPAAELMLGHSAAVTLGVPLQDLVSAPGLLEIITAGGVSDQVLAVSTATGEQVMVEWSAITLGPAADGAEDIMLIGRDMSAQLRAEHERREALRAAAMATWTADASLANMSWSDELYELIGVDPRRFVPSLRSCWALLDRDERARARRLRRRMTSSPQFRFTFRIERPSDGAARFMEVEGRRVGSDRMIGTARDVTTQRRAVDRLRELDHQRGQLLERMLLTEEEERGRIARALHDDTVQLMAALQINLDRIQRVLGGEQPVATTLVSETRLALSAALERTRHLMFELRPQRFDRHGLRFAITALCEEVGREAGFAVSVEVPELRFDGVVEELCYRTVREAVVNARKHSEAAHLWVRLYPTMDAIAGIVRDDGRGFDPHRLDPQHMRLHMGLEAMTERVRLAGGSCGVASEPGGGCTVSFTIPLVSSHTSARDAVV
jgi:PAS domain S-box-containing protein